GLHKNLRIQLPPIEHSAHVEDIVASRTAIARIFLAIFLAVASLFFWQWELYSWQWECLVHFIPNKGPYLTLNGGFQGAQNVVQNVGVQNGGNHNGLVVVPGIANQSGSGNVVVARAEGAGIGNQARCYNCNGLGHIARNCTARPRRRDAVYLQTQLLIAQKEKAGIQLQDEEFDFMAAAGDLDEIEEVNANCILMANLQQASTSSTQLDKAPVYDTNGSAEAQLNDNYYDNEIFNMFTQEEHYMIELSFPSHKHTKKKEK
nr:hypothetical protein [Tanacetum cinerariifolium]